MNPVKKWLRPAIGPDALLQIKNKSKNGCYGFQNNPEATRCLSWKVLES